MPSPLVTVICLCYNQKRFVREAVESVLQQTHPNIQLIIVDDASTDGSAEEIKLLKLKYPAIEVLLLDKNYGSCKAFNKTLPLVKGEYLIDLAADDVLLPTRVEIGVRAFQEAGEAFGINFTDAEWINEKGEHLYNHSDRFPHASIPQGYIYKELVARYFICPPTLMFKTSVIDHLGGYDEALRYEDFDFLIRSSRVFKYCYTPVVLVKKRVVKRALGRKQFQFFSKHSQTTYKVCKKIMQLNQTEAESAALSKRLLYEMKLNARLLNFGLVKKYFRLWNENKEKL